MKIVGVVVLVVLGLALWWAFVAGPLRDPKDAYSDFLAGVDREEIRLTDPLVLAGSRVLPLVAADIPNPNSPKRRYAIGHLGCVQYEPAVPSLRAILENETERDYFRADALEAIWQINPSEGLDLAARYRSRGDFLGESAGRLVAGEPLIYCRLWLDALLGSVH